MVGQEPRHILFIAIGFKAVYLRQAEYLSRPGAQRASPRSAKGETRTRGNATDHGIRSAIAGNPQQATLGVDSLPLLPWLDPWINDVHAGMKRCISILTAQFRAKELITSRFLVPLLFAIVYKHIVTCFLKICFDYFENSAGIRCH